MSSLILGIDIGTTNVKACVFDENERKVLSEVSEAHTASANCGLKKEQDPAKVFAALNKCTESIPISLRTSVRKISVCGQMHGVCLWNPRCWEFQSETNTYVIDNENCFNNITWEDGRCGADFLKSLPESSNPPSSGFGTATLIWFAKNNPEVLNDFACAGTILEFIVCILTGNTDPIMSDQLANSWGYYDVQSRKWEGQLISNYPILKTKMPKIAKSGAVCGNLQNSWLAIPQKAEVVVALGDFQCSAHASLATYGTAEASDFIFNFGTGCQLALPVKCHMASKFDDIKSVNVWPYFGNSHMIAVAASLNGGNILQHLMFNLCNLISSLNIKPPSEAELWEMVDKLDFDESSSQIHISPVLFRERHDTERRFSIANIHPDFRLSLSSLFSAFCLGITRNMKELFPPNLIESQPNGRLICVGKIFKIRVMKEAVRRVFSEFEIVFTESSNSALGAALSASLVK